MAVSQTHCWLSQQAWGRGLQETKVKQQRPKLCAMLRSNSLGQSKSFEANHPLLKFQQPLVSRQSEQCCLQGFSSPQSTSCKSGRKLSNSGRRKSRKSTVLRASNSDDNETESTSGNESGEKDDFASDSAATSQLRLPKIAKVDQQSIGASRFDVSVRALKGDFDPPTPAQNTEKGTLLEALVQFPSYYTFSVVGQVETSTEGAGDAFAKDTLEAVERICGTRLATNHYSVRHKFGGRFVSLRITTMVQSADLVRATYAEFKKDPRLKFAY